MIEPSIQNFIDLILFFIISLHFLFRQCLNIYLSFINLNQIRIINLMKNKFTKEIFSL